MQDEYLTDMQETDFTLQPKKPKAIARVFLCQFIVCIAILSALGGMKFMLPQTYSQIQSELQAALTGPDFQSGFTSCWNQFLDFIGKFTPLGSEQTPAQPSEQSSEQVSESLPEQSSDQPSSQSNAEEIQSVQYPGNLQIPLSGSITSPFEERVNPVTGEKEAHHGIDIAAPEGTAVAAMDDGQVKQSTFSDISGNHIFLDHNNHFISFYAHCSELLVGEGDQVKRGQIIAKSGHTGQATGPHLHFGIQKDGEWINPQILFPEMI